GHSASLNYRRRSSAPGGGVLLSWLRHVWLREPPGTFDGVPRNRRCGDGSPSARLTGVVHLPPRDLADAAHRHRGVRERRWSTLLLRPSHRREPGLTGHHAARGRQGQAAIPGDVGGPDPAALRAPDPRDLRALEGRAAHPHPRRFGDHEPHDPCGAEPAHLRLTMPDRSTPLPGPRRRLRRAHPVLWIVAAAGGGGRPPTRGGRLAPPRARWRA